MKILKTMCTYILYSVLSELTFEFISKCIDSLAPLIVSSQSQMHLVLCISSFSLLKSYSLEPPQQHHLHHLLQDYIPDLVTGMSLAIDGVIVHVSMTMIFLRI